MSPAGGQTGFADSSGRDRSLSVVVPRWHAEEVGAILMDVLGPFQEAPEPGSDAQPSPGAAGDWVRLIFYPDVPPAPGGCAPWPPENEALPAVSPTVDDILALLPEELRVPGMVRVETGAVERDWVDGWKEHFQPILIGNVRIRPPWEEPLTPSPAGLVEVVINPGLGFGTGLHPTTRGTLRLLQHEAPPAAGGGAGSGRVLDAGTGSGVLSIAAAKLGWGPIVAFDNDPVALISARENVETNGVGETVTLLEAGIEEVRPEWSAQATVLANMTLDPVLALLQRLAALGTDARPDRMVVSGILAGEQEERLLTAAHETGFISGQRVYEAEWVSLELVPAPASQE